MCLWSATRLLWVLKVERVDMEMEVQLHHDISESQSCKIRSINPYLNLESSRLALAIS